MDDVRTRRAFLAAVASATAGCAYGDGKPATTGASATPTTATCESMVRVDVDISTFTFYNATTMEWESYDPQYTGIRFAETVPGLKFQLLNRGDQPVETGPKDHYAIQHNDGSGWRHILYTADPGLEEGETVTHQPGEGFTWEFTLDTDFRQDGYAICEPIPEGGAFRFVYFGLPKIGEDDTPTATERALLVPHPTINPTAEE